LPHLLVGSEGTLAYTRQLTLQLALIPRFKVLGIVNFATFQQAMTAPEHIVKLGPSAVELVDRVMIDLSMGKRGISRHHFHRADRRARPRFCWWSSPMTTSPCARALAGFDGADGRSWISRAASWKCSHPKLQQNLWDCARGAEPSI